MNRSYRVIDRYISGIVSLLPRGEVLNPGKDMGTLREAHASPTENNKQELYKPSLDSCDSEQEQFQAQPSLSLCRRTFAGAIAIMLSAWFLAKVLVAFAPLTTVFAQYNTTARLPLLLDATAEELAIGLAAGDFTSVDLVEVCTNNFRGFAQRYDMVNH